ncbi:tripartite tricarboxylate transporter substrate binding protein [Ramlibacter tataouinensis]|uniref:Bug family tripartite tricarboxylate transporter substrate binding protein n=1 Tax=Ramlibacter tataouinensis TaxID=94132 RepID=UPI0022F3DFBF|nr:tripartite tricarboxylate transporter substrate binding protein [Ramlibacter tataouinensis]WBY02886.1 tripartite tricarboxylate transporter substrate binding protein [Ramlibacter tataouinensis]
MQRRHFLQAAGALGAASVGLPALAQAWPARPVRMVVTFPAGSSPDVVARLLTEPLSKVLGQPVVVENKPGAGGSLGTGFVARSEADSHTFLFTTQGPLVTTPLLTPNLNHDPARDLAPVTHVATSPNVLVASPRLGAKSVADFVRIAREKKGALNYGSIGNGSATHLAMELLKSRAGVDALHVPYQGLPQVMNAILAGELDVAFTVPSVAMPHVQAGKLQVLGVSTLQRTTALPDLPTIAEQGYAGFEAISWHAVLAPAKTPAAVITRVNQELVKIIRSEAVAGRLQQQYFAAVGSSPAELAALMDRERQVWGQVMRTAKVTSE